MRDPPRRQISGRNGIAAQGCLSPEPVFFPLKTTLAKPCSSAVEILQENKLAKRGKLWKIRSWLWAGQEAAPLQAWCRGAARVARTPGEF